MLSTRTYQRWQLLILAATGLFLIEKIWSKSLFWYINERFWLLVLVAGIGLLVLAQVGYTQLRATKASHQHSHDAHDHDHDHPQSWHGMLWLALPVLLGILIPAKPLGSSAISNRGINVNAPLTSQDRNSVARIQIAPADRTVLDWVRAFNYSQDPQEFVGQPVDILGFVYHDSRLSDNTFLLGRFSLSCCVADALAIGVVVQNAQAQDLKDNIWLHIQGTMQVTEINGTPTPLVIPTTMQEVPEPDQPYLYY
jgi:putative membrane protein